MDNFASRHTKTNTSSLVCTLKVSGGFGNQINVFMHCFLLALITDSTLMIRRERSKSFKHVKLPYYVKDIGENIVYNITEEKLNYEDILRDPSLIYNRKILLGGTPNWNYRSTHKINNSLRDKMNTYFIQNKQENTYSHYATVGFDRFVHCAMISLLQPSDQIYEKMVPHLRLLMEMYRSIGVHSRNSDAQMASNMNIESNLKYPKGHDKYTKKRKSSNGNIFGRNRRLKVTNMDEYDPSREISSLGHRKLFLDASKRSGCLTPVEFMKCIENVHMNVKTEAEIKSKTLDRNSKIYYMIGSDSKEMRTTFNSRKGANSTIEPSFVDDIQGTIVHSGRSIENLSDIAKKVVEEGYEKVIIEFFLLTVTDIFLTNCRFPSRASAREGNTFAYNIMMIRGDYFLNYANTSALTIIESCGNLTSTPKGREFYTHIHNLK